jgi:PAS domain S-box-containing protein
LVEAQRLAKIGSWTFDFKTRTLSWSEELYNVYGTDKQTFLPTNNSFRDLIEAEDREIVLQASKHTQETGESYTIEYNVITPKGEKRVILELGYAHKDANGNVIRLFGTAQNITERKKAEQALRISNERYELLAKVMNDSIWDWDLTKNEILRPGKKLENLLGYEGVKAPEVDNFWDEHVHPEDRAKMKQLQKLVFENPEEHFLEGEYRFRKPDGQYAYVYTKSYIIRDAEGKAIRLIGASKDITKEKEQINEIIRIQQNLDSLINNTNDLIWSVDPDFKIIAANKALKDSMERLKGYPVKEGDNVLLSFSEEIANQWTGLYKRALAGESFSIEDSVYKPALKDYLYNIISLSPIIGNDGHILGVACFAKDISELKRSASKVEEINIILQKKAEELAISNTELEQFAYVASHDLQEPLRMITNFLTQLDKKYSDIIDEKGKKYIYFAVDGAKRMRQIILDLLEFSRVGRTEHNREDLDLNELVKEINLLSQKQIEDKSAVIQAGELPVIHAYKAPLRQVFQNLIGNALTYTRKDIQPQIQITAQELNNHWQFAVTDNGIGIEEEYFEKIFVIFQRLHNKQEYSGTGMGLAVTKKIVENLGGKIWVKSEEGKGSTFYFTIKKQIP